MGKKQRRSRQQEEQVETPAAPHEDAPPAAAEEEAAQEVAVEGQTQGATDGGVKEEGRGEAAAKEVSFDELGLDEQLKRALRKKGMTNTTLIQREAIPRILEGNDLVAQAKTGSGKTFAYLLPLLQKLLSPDIVKLAKLLLHNPDILTLTEISCSEKDKMLYILALLKLELIQKKVLIFVNSIDMAFRLRLFLEKFGIRSAVLNAELPQNSRLHIIEAFNARLFDYLIATDDNKTKEAKQTNKENKKDSRGSRKHMQQTLDAEFGVVRGIDFKNVFTVVNFDMPPDPAGYIHRIGRTGRANKTGASISLVSPEEDDVFEEIENMLQDVEKKDTKCILPFPLLTTNAVESLRYRAQDVARSVTSRDIQEARRQDIKNEILNSDKLKAHFEENPTDLDLLKHDKILSNKAIPLHLRDVPEYLIDPTTKEASNAIKLSRAAMGVDNPGRKKRMGFRRGSGKSSDPLRTFSAEIMYSGLV
ncbi:hypothetical protein ACQ4PT_010754 [Festuca glaucescens]